MALRLRRGTEAERLLITPLQGELIYATDTRQLFVGDGATVGGVLVGPVDAETFDLINDTTPQLGGDLDLNNNNITGVGNINIDGTISATGNIGLGDADNDEITVGGVINSSLRPAMSEAYDLGTSARKWREIVSQGASIDGEARVGSLIVVNNIAGSDSSIIYNAATDSLTASTVSAVKVTGDLVGSVFADDSSSILIDAVANEVTGTINTRSLTVSKDATDPTPGDVANFNAINSGDLPFINMQVAKGTIANPQENDPGDDVGGYRINSWANGEYKTVTALLSVLDANADTTTANPQANFYVVVGNNNQQTFFFFQGDGTFKSPGAVKTGVYADASARDAAIPTPEAGMVVFVTDVAKHQGYDGTAWNDLY